MSGGHFDYQQYRLHDIAQRITELIESNDDTSQDSWGQPRGRGYSAGTINTFAQAVTMLRLAEVYAQRIDWLVSGDDSEESYQRRLLDDLAKLVDEVKVQP